MAAAGLEFGQVWTLQYLMRRRVLECLCQVAQLSAAQMVTHRAEIHRLLEQLISELGTLSPGAGERPRSAAKAERAEEAAALFAPRTRPLSPS